MVEQPRAPRATSTSSLGACGSHLLASRAAKPAARALSRPRKEAHAPKFAANFEDTWPAPAFTAPVPHWQRPHWQRPARTGPRARCAMAMLRGLKEQVEAIATGPLIFRLDSGEMIVMSAERCWRAEPEIFRNHRITSRASADLQ